MNLIVTLDDQNGMLFNHRRQSRDRVLNDRIATLCGGRLTVTAYTAALLEGLPVDLTISEDPLAATKPGDWCFLEDRSPARVLEKIEKPAFMSISSLSVIRTVYVPSWFLSAFMVLSSISVSRLASHGCVLK